MATEKSKKSSKNSNVKKGRRYSPAEKKEILSELKSKTLSEIYKQYGVVSETIRRWKKYDKFFKEKENKNSIVDGSFSGYHQNWTKALDLWKSRPGLGPTQIRNQLYREGIKISVTTVRNILIENGYTPPKTIIKNVSVRRYEACRPGEIIHLDFKHFYINKQKVYLLFLQDDFSRFLCGYKMTASENMKDVIEAFELCVKRYGKMQTIMTDGGSAFYCWNGINAFQRLLAEEYGIDHIKAGSPRSNGKIESVNKQFEKEILKVQKFSSLNELDEAIREWVSFYNFERTHMGLPQGLVPADRFLYGWNKTNSEAHQLKSNNKNIWKDFLKLVLKTID
jgi:putative transposase